MYLASLPCSIQSPANDETTIAKVKGTPRTEQFDWDRGAVGTLLNGFYLVTQNYYAETHRFRTATCLPFGA